MTDDFLVPDASPLEQAIYRHHREQTHETKQDMLELVVDDFGEGGYVPVMFLAVTEDLQILGYPAACGDGTDRFSIVAHGMDTADGRVCGSTFGRSEFSATLSRLILTALDREDMQLFLWPTHAVVEQILVFSGLRGLFKARRWFDQFGVCPEIRKAFGDNASGHLAEEPGLYKDYLEVLRLNLAIASKLARKRRER